jgi:hypothetical protein
MGKALHAVRPSMRIGINAGSIVVGYMRGGTTGLGDTVNLQGPSDVPSNLAPDRSTRMEDKHA